MEKKPHSCSTQKRELSFSHFLLLRLKFEKKEPRLSGLAIRRVESHCEKLGFSPLWMQLSGKDKTVWSRSLLFPRKQAGVKLLRKQQQRLRHCAAFRCGKRQKTSWSGLKVRNHLLVPYKEGNALQLRPQMFLSCFPITLLSDSGLRKGWDDSQKPYNGAGIVFACFYELTFTLDKKTWAQKSTFHIPSTDFWIFWP